MDLSSIDPTLKGGVLIIHWMTSATPIPFFFPVKPQMYGNNFPARMAVHPTLGGAFVDDFSGPDSILATVTLSGIFPYHNRAGGLGPALPGSVHLKAFETIYETFNSLPRETKARGGARQEYYDLSRLHAWEVAIHSFGYRRRKDDPLVATYDLRMTRVRDYLNPLAVAGAVTSAVTAGAAAIGAAF